MSLNTDTAQQLLYNHALGHDIEFTASGYWEGYLQLKFPRHEGYVFLSQQAPTRDSRDRDRVDGEVRQARSLDYFPTLLFEEAKRKDSGRAGIKDAENQILSRAEKYLTVATDQHYVYGFTGWGVHGRAWIIKRTPNGFVMEPMFGPDTRADETSYVDGGTDPAWFISQAMAVVKDEPPPDMPPSL